MTEAVMFLSGALSMGYAVAALYFARFWRQTGERLFAWFAWAFALLAVHRIAVSFVAHDALYLIRLAAFVLIIIAIVEKNRAWR